MKFARSTFILLTSLATAPVWAAGSPYQACFDIASNMHQVPVDLLMAVATTESAGNPDARSNKNAHGIMQIQWPGTARHLGVRRVSELYNPCLNIELGARYLRELLDANGGDVERALAAYNYGPGRIRRSAQLPEGARRYAKTVSGHQTRINRNTSELAATIDVDESVWFDSGTRARHFAASLNKRINGATFESERSQDGRYLISMTVSGQGLSAGDVVTLKTLGWSQLGVDK